MGTCYAEDSLGEPQFNAGIVVVFFRDVISHSNIRFYICYLKWKNEYKKSLYKTSGKVLRMHERFSLQVIGAVGFMDQRLEIPKDVEPQWAYLIKSCWHRFVFTFVLKLHAS